MLGKETNSKRKIGKVLLYTFFAMGMAVLINLILQLFQLNFDIDHLMAQVFHSKTLLFFLSSAIIFTIILWFTALFGNLYLSFFVTLILSVVIGIANQQKLMFRGEPLYPSDFDLIKSLPFLLSMVSPWLIVLLSLLIIATTIISIFIYKKTTFKHTRVNYFIRSVIFVVASMLIYYVGQFNQPENYVKAYFDKNAYWTTFSQQMNYEGNGFIPGFLYNLNAPAVELPEGYSKESVKQVVKKYQQKAVEINNARNNQLEDINVVYIMNESFSDPLAIEGMTISKDPIPNTRKLMEENQSGKVLSQGYGGGTANNEFEALTGISMEPLASNITTPYIQLTKQIEQYPTILSYLKESNHFTTAIHPFNTTMYKRKDVYSSMGFDEFVNEDTMYHKEIKENNRYISDESAYKEIITRMEETDKKDFIHLVTMQNHTKFTGKYPNTPFHASGSADDEEAINYYQDLAYSDDALKDLLGYLDHFKEKTMVVFWGDHLPGFYGYDLMEKNGRQVMHETPLMIYTNYQYEEKSMETISPIFFVNHILSANKGKVTPYEALLFELEKKLPAFETGIYIEKDAGEMKEKRNQLSEETNELLSDYDKILYDLSVGSNYAEKLGFYNLSK